MPARKVIWRTIPVAHCPGCGGALSNMHYYCRRCHACGQDLDIPEEERLPESELLDGRYQSQLLHSLRGSNRN